MVSGLIFLLFLLVLVDLEVAQLVALLGVSHNPQPVPEVVLLEVLLGEVLQIPERDEADGETITENLSQKYVMFMYFFPSHFGSAPDSLQV